MMKRKVGTVGAVLAFVLGFAVLSPAQTKTLTILHTNDTHSALLPFTHQPYPTLFTWFLGGHGQGGQDGFCGPGGFDREYAGIARMSTLIKKIRMGKKNVLALNAGDVFVGSFEFNEYLGYPELKIMENLYDAMTLGNHEFDLGLGALAGVVTGALAGGDPVQLPLLCANFAFVNPHDATDPTNILAGIVKESIVRTIDGVKVGIFGLGDEDPINYSPDIAARFSGHPLEVAATQAASLKASGCQVVICLSHEGTSFDVNELSKVAGIDIIVGGHSHDLFKKAVLRNGKIIVQAGSHGRYLGELQVKVDAGRVKFLNWRTHEVDKTVKPDRTIEAQLNVLRQGIEARFGHVYTDPVAYALRDISHDWPAVGPFRDAPLGILVSDAMKRALLASPTVPPVDCVLDAMGYTEFGIPAGKVVGNDILRAVPYGYDEISGLGFKVVATIVPLEVLIGGLEYSVASVETEQSVCLQPSGLTFRYDSSKPAGSRVDLSSIKIGGVSVAELGRDYCVVGLTDQVFNFFNGLTGGQLTRYDPDPPIFEYNAVRDYMKSLGFVFYRSEGRVIDTATGGGRR
ncbi:MAG: bifunctional metallophosphatase/5'-nucleotidase [Candidatus Aminicenantales bacterium]